MKMSLPRYDRYKDSGVEWLGEIPENWNVERAKWIFKQVKRPTQKDDNVVTCFRDGQVTLRSNRRTDGFTNAIQEHGYQGIRKGDLIIHAMDAFAGAIGVSDSDGKSTPVYSVCLPRGEYEIDNYFYAYLIRYIALSGFILSLAKGIRERSTDFRYKDFAELLLPVPNVAEQKRIAEFLDRKCGEIDEAIAKKQRLIELLEEQKTILINQAVTKGLNPDAPMKDSGIEWLGEIPKHWEVKRIKYLVSTSGGFAFNSSLFQDHGIQLIRIGNLYKNRLALERQPVFLDIKLQELYRDFMVKKGDLLMSLTGTLGKKDYGYAILVEDEKKFFLNQRVAKLKANKNILPKYALLVLRSEQYLNQIFKLPSGTKQANLSDSDIRSPSVAIPGIDEQLNIVSFIRNTDEVYKEIINKSEKAIKYLSELKQILIAEAVTGKIKV